MADEEKKKSSADAKDSGGFGDVMGRIGEGLIDGLAQANPIIGRPLQAAFNTEEYQDKQLRRQAAKEALIASRQRNEEWQKSAPLREKQRRAEEMKADEYTAGAADREAERKHRRMQLAEYAAGAPVRQMQRDEYLRDAPVREAQSAASLARASLAAEQADTNFKQARCAALRDGLKKDLAQNPAFGTMSFAEQDDFCNSPRVQTMIEAKFYLGEIQAIAQNDQGAFGRMDRALRRQGWSLVDGKDGIKYLDMGERGKIPATKEAMDALNKQITSAALEELNTRSLIADASTMGNPAKRSIASRTKALMPYNGNDATSSLRMVEGIFNNASEEEKGWHLFHQAISDYQSSGLPTAAKMDGLAACMPFLQKMGYAIEGLDPKKPNVEAVTVIDLKNKTRMSFSEFAERCKENDKLGSRLDETIASARKSAVARDKEIFAREVSETQQALRLKQLNAPTKSGKGKGDDWFGGKDKENGDKSSSDVSSLHSIYGKEDSEKLSKKQREGLNDAIHAFNDELISVAQKYGKRTRRELPDEALTELENYWSEKMKDLGLDPSVYYSPVNSMIRQRSIKSLSAATADKESTVAKTEQFNEEWDNAYHGIEDEEDRGAIFRRNFRLMQERADRDRTKKRNDEKIREHQEALKRRGK